MCDDGFSHDHPIVRQCPNLEKLCTPNGMGFEQTLFRCERIRFDWEPGVTSSFAVFQTEPPVPVTPRSVGERRGTMFKDQKAYR